MLFWTAIIILLAASIVGGAWFIKTQGGNGVFGGSLFAPRPEPRLAVMEHASVDGRRRLLLIRRDDVEHLIMTGGPVDVVIETGIGAQSDAAKSEPRRAEPARFEQQRIEQPRLETVETAVGGDLKTGEGKGAAFGRRPRAIGQAVND